MVTPVTPVRPPAEVQVRGRELSAEDVTTVLRLAVGAVRAVAGVVTPLPETVEDRLK